MANTKSPLNGPVVGVVSKVKNGIIAELHVTPEGLRWNGEAPSDLMAVAEEEVRRRFGGLLDKLVMCQELEFHRYTADEIEVEGELSLHIAWKDKIESQVGCLLEELTLDFIADQTERRHWAENSLRLGEDVIQLEGWKRLVRHYGKYRSQLSILVASYHDFHWILAPNLAADMNIRFDGETSFMRGEYFVSKKGTKCFRVKKDGPHLLVRSEWGGAFSDARGFAWWRKGEVPEGTIYFRRASSNGGGMGNDYIVIPVGHRVRLREEDVI